MVHGAQNRVSGDFVGLLEVSCFWLFLLRFVDISCNGHSWKIGKKSGMKDINVERSFRSILTVFSAEIKHFSSNFGLNKLFCPTYKPFFLEKMPRFQLKNVKKS